MEVTPASFTHVFRPVSNPGIDWTLLLLHGTGGDETSLIEFGSVVGHGAAMLGVRGKSMEEGYPRYFRRMAEGVLDEDDIKLKAAEMAAWLKLTPRDNGYDPKRLIAIGYSNGANMAAALMLLYPETLMAAILLRPMVPLVPIPAPDLSGKKVLILSGDQDRVIPTGDGIRLGHMLTDYGALVDTVQLPTGHGLTYEDESQASEYLLQF